MIKKNISLFIVLPLLFSFSCEQKYEYTPTPLPEPEKEALSKKELLDITQKMTFKYFWDYAESISGAARERYIMDNPSRDEHVVTTGGTGFGLMAILVAIERGFVSKKEAISRLKKIFNFLESADRFHGAWSHWIYGTSGKVKPFSTFDDGADLVETSFLVQGLVCIVEYFKNGSEEEKALSKQADLLWKGVKWEDFVQNDQLYWHWSPNHGFKINFALKGYNEVLITYVMAAASPDYSISKKTYTKGWLSNGEILSPNKKYNYPLIVKHNGSEEYGGPLFWAHYSYLGLRPEGLIDQYVNYGEVNKNHTKINYTYCVNNEKKYRDYGEDCWGLTASYTRSDDGGLSYAAHSPTEDRGVISPTAALSSIVYTPKESLKVMKYLYRHKDKLLGPAGFYDAFSPHYDFWVAKAYLSIDQGPIIVMIENYRTGLLWNLFMGNKDVQRGLTKLGFSYKI